jgi:4-amino-4-deoxy-L-arabinose transferase-like glycosyltransferase
VRHRRTVPNVSASNEINLTSLAIALAATHAYKVRLPNLHMGTEAPDYVVLSELWYGRYMPPNPHIQKGSARGCRTREGDEVRTHTGGMLSPEHHGWQDRHRQEFSLLIGIVALALATRLTVAVLTTSWVFPSDGHFWEFGYEMGQIAASIAMGNGFSWPEWSPYPQGPTAWMPPVYPLVMAGAFKIFGVYSESAAITLELLQTILSALTCVVLYALGKRLYNAHAGLLAAGLFAIYPPAIYYAVGMIWGTSLFTGCLLVVILMFLRQADHPHMKGGIGLGTMLGFTALVDPIIVSVYPFACAWLYFKAAGDRRTVINMMAVMLIFFGLVISPWVVRNYIVFGRFVFIKSNLGQVLFLGKSHTSDEPCKDALSACQENVKTIPFTEAEQKYLKHSDEVTGNNFLLRKAIAFIWEHPLPYMQLTLKRFALYWTYMRPVEGWKAKISLSTYLIVLMLAIAGLILSRANGREIQLVLLFPLVLPLIYYFTIVGIFRYRFPVEPILIVFAGYTIYWIAYRCRERFSQPIMQ